MNQIGTFKDSSEICAIAVGKSTDVFTHCGILYSSEKDGKRNTYFLHLGNPLYLYNNSDNAGDEYNYISVYSNFIWMPFNNVPVQLLRLTRTKCELISHKNRALPYGIFHDEKTEFDAEGNLILGTDSSGLTCASFVKVVLKGSSIDVLDDTDWPDDREEDLNWLNSLIADYDKVVSEMQEKIKIIDDKIGAFKSQKTSPVIQINIKILTDEKNKIGKKILLFSKVIEELKEGREDFFKRYRPEEISAAGFSAFELFPIKCRYDGDESEKIGAEIMGVELVKQLT